MAPAEGLVVALHAPWGSGKTSALNLVQRHLAVLDIAELRKKSVEEVAGMAAARSDSPSVDERQLADEWTKLLCKHAKDLKTTAVRFNPWYFSGQENLFKAFFGVLGTELSITDNTKVAKAVAAVLKRADAAGSMLGTAAGLIAAGPAGAGGGAAIGGFFGRLAGDKFDKKESLEASLQRLRDALEGSARRLLIIIDDIDRLLPEELRQLLTLIKSLGNLPNVTYLLAFARAEVVDLIKQAGISNADYLDKIMQVSFELPRVDRYALRAMFFNRLDAIRRGKELEDTSRWSQAFFNHVDPYLRTPRDVTRMCNSLQVIWPAVEDEVDWSDLVVLEILRLHEPDIYDVVLDRLDLLTGETPSFSDDKEWAQPIIAVVEKNSEAKRIKETLMYLFPRLAKALERNSFVYTNDKHALRNRQLQCSEYARNYFSLAPAADQFSAAQIRSLFKSDDAKQAFDRLYGEAVSRKTRQGLSMVSRLLLQIRDEIAPSNILQPALARAILAKSDEIVRLRDGERNLFETNNDLRLSWVLVEALRALPERDRAAAARDWFDGTVGAAFLVRFIGTMTSNSGRSAEYIFPEVDRIALREFATATIRELFKEADVLRKPHAASLLFSWGHLAGFDEVKEWIKSRLNDEEAVLDIATMMPSEVYSSPGGLWYRIDRQGWSLLLDVDAFAKQLRRLCGKKGKDAVGAETLQKFEEALAKGDRQHAV
jgi:hypothetical protein